MAEIFARPFESRPAPLIDSIVSGERFRTARADRNALIEAGQLGAQGDLRGAENRALGAGLLEAAGQFAGERRSRAQSSRAAQDRQREQQLQALQLTARVARGAQTPEQFAAGIDVLENEFGFQIPEQFKDFANRDLAVSMVLSEAERLERLKAGADLRKSARESSRKETKLAQELRKEFTSVSSDFREISDGLSRVQAGAQLETGAGDIATVIGFMKILDPGSVVREGEFATAENAQGVPDRVRSIYNRLLTGQRLSPQVREEFVQAAESLARRKLSEQTGVVEQFRTEAGRAGIDPDRVIVDLGSGEFGDDPSSDPQSMSDEEILRQLGIGN